MYIQSIVREEMRNKIDNVLFKYCNNYAAEVYVYGITPRYDSGIRSAREATIKNFTEALPNDNLSIVWIAFDKDEIGDDYERVEEYLAEFVEDFALTFCGIHCYFVSSDIVSQGQEKIITNHSEYNYDVLNDMEILLSGQHPHYHYSYYGNENSLVLRDIYS